MGGVLFEYRTADSFGCRRIVLFQMKLGQVDSSHRVSRLLLQNQLKAFAGQLGFTQFLQRQPEIHQRIDVVGIEVDCPFVCPSRSQMIAFILCHLAKVEMSRSETWVKFHGTLKSQSRGSRLAKRIVGVALVEVKIGASWLKLDGSLVGCDCLFRLAKRRKVECQFVVVFRIVRL